VLNCASCKGLALTIPVSRANFDTCQKGFARRPAQP